MARHSMAEYEADVSNLARKIVLRRTAVMGVVTAVLVVLVASNAIDLQQSKTITSFIIGGFVFLSKVATGFWIQRDTTPADPALKPMSKDLEPLVPDPAMSQTGVAHAEADGGLLDGHPDLEHLMLADDPLGSSPPSADVASADPSQQPADPVDPVPTQ